MSKRYFRWRFM